MPHSQRRQTLVIGHWSLVIILCLLASLHPLHPSVPSDEAALRALVEKFFAAYAQKDLDGFMALWCKESPDVAARRRMMEQRFVAYEKIEVKSLTVRRVMVDGEKARVRVVVEMSAVEAKTGKPARGFGKMNRTLHGVTEEGAWKVWREVSSEEDLAAMLVAAKTEEERAALLAGEKELVTGELRRVLLNQGNRFYERRNYPQALTIYRLAQGIAEQIGDKAGIAQTLGSIGNVHYLQGNHEQAREFFQKSLMLSEASGDKAGTARALMSIGIVHWSQGNYVQALEHYQKSLVLGEQLGDKAGIAATLNNVGVVYEGQGNYAQSLEHYQKAQLQFEALGDKAGIARTLNNIGGVHRLQGDYGEALEHYQKSLTLKEQLGDKAGIAATLTNIGIVHSKQGNYVQALEHYQKSLVLGEQLGDKAGIAATLTSIGVVHSKQGNYAQALEFYQKGLALAEAIGVSRTIFLCYQGIGSVHKAQRNTEKALVAYRNAITLIESMRGQIAGGEQEQQRFFEGKVAVYHAMVDLLIEQYRRVADTSPLEALTYAERAKARVLLDVLHSGKVNITKTMTETEREREQALNNELVSLNTQITRESQRSQPELTHLANLKANLQKARLDYEAFQTSLYAAHPELKVQRGETKSITLDEARALLPDAVGRAASATALLEFVVTEAKTYLFVLTPNVQGLRVKGSQQPSTLNPQPLASTLNPQPLTLKVYSLDIKRDELAKRVKEFREEVSDPNRPVDTARPLYDQLLKPAQAQLQGKTTLIIVPDGVLWDLPFQALQPREGRYLLEDFNLFYAPSLTVLREMARLRAKGSNAKGLGLRVKGSSAKNQPSTLNPQPSTLGALLAFGNPTLGQKAVERVQFVKRDANLKPLLEAEKEVKALAQLYGAGRSRVYVGANAQEERVKAEAGEYRVLHFATHGILNDVSPMYSHLLLAQSVGQRVNESMKNIDPLTHLPIDPLTQVEDGLLEAWELMKLDLQADLVVLSACQTARGRVGAGEGIIGLTWALFVAGCPTTVVSQWEVDSASTAQLMVEFHKRLKLAVSSEQSAVSRRARNPFPFTKAEALRQAALMLRRSRQYRHPFYWAGFVVVGDGR